MQINKIKTSHISRIWGVSQIMEPAYQRNNFTLKYMNSDLNLHDREHYILILTRQWWQGHKTLSITNKQNKEETKETQ